jgi:hypothetical protein
MVFLQRVKKYYVVITLFPSSLKSLLLEEKGQYSEQIPTSFFSHIGARIMLSSYGKLKCLIPNVELNS